MEMSKYKGDDLELKCVNSIRVLSADQPNAAKSGHPGAPMGCAPLAHVLWGEIMRYSPSDPKWMNRDRFVLSNGHACALLYSMLHLTGYELTMEDLRQFRQVESRTPGHPENFLTAGVEVCTGPLGQGISQAVGLAVGQTHMAAVYNTEHFEIFDHWTYVICGDGCLQEGISSEASSLAGHFGLGRLIVLYDDNKITIDGPTDLAFTEDVLARYRSYGWHVQSVDDVAQGLGPLREAIAAARAETQRPSLIKVSTLIGHGSRMEGSEKTHGAPLDGDDLASVKRRFGMDPDVFFHVDQDVYDYFRKKAAAAEEHRDRWVQRFAAYKEAHPEKAAEIERRFAGDLGNHDDLFADLPTFAYGVDKPLATRKYSEACLNALAPKLPELIGGSADLTNSNGAKMKCTAVFQKATPSGRNIHFGVREHAMTAICNGLFAYGCFRPYCATFLNFAGYAMGAIRLSALSRFGLVFVMTHDSIGLGEDGPTHQPVEMLESLRSMPNVLVLRPADCHETSAAYRVALLRAHTPSVICCTRGTVPALESSNVQRAMKGAYSVVEEEAPALILVASGSEVGPCVAAAKELAAAGVKTRVVSMPCQEIFLEQSQEYQRSVLPGNVPTLSVEASAPHGWQAFSHAQIAIHRFGLSGPANELFEKFGFGKDNIVAKGKALLDYYKEIPVPNLAARPFFANEVLHGMPSMNGSS